MRACPFLVLGAGYWVLGAGCWCTIHAITDDFRGTALEGPINSFLLLVVPSNISESVLDHDYTLFAMQRYAEGSKSFWTNIIAGAKKVERLVVEPLLAFQRGALKDFKVCIRAPLGLTPAS